MPPKGRTNQVLEHGIDFLIHSKFLSSDYGGLLKQIRNMIQSPNAGDTRAFEPLFVLKEDYHIVKGCLRFLGEKSGKLTDDVKLLYLEDLLTALQEAAPLAERKFLHQTRVVFEANDRFEATLPTKNQSYMCFQPVKNPMPSNPSRRLSETGTSPETWTCIAISLRIRKICVVVLYI
jgi:hypothetical protein